MNIAAFTRGSLILATTFICIEPTIEAGASEKGGGGQTTTVTDRRYSGRDAGSQGERHGPPDLGMAAMLLHRVRYFSDGAVIGSREFVNAAFASARERFGAKRKDGARALRGSGSAAKGVLWSARDLRVGV